MNEKRELTSKHRATDWWIFFFTFYFLFITFVWCMVRCVWVVYAIYLCVHKITRLYSFQSAVVLNIVHCIWKPYYLSKYLSCYLPLFHILLRYKQHTHIVRCRFCFFLQSRCVIFSLFHRCLNNFTAFFCHCFSSILF